MKYGVFTTSNKKFEKCCREIFDSVGYKGYYSLPMKLWTRNRIVLANDTDITWIDSTGEEMEMDLTGTHFHRIFVLDEYSREDFLKIQVRWNTFSIPLTRE